jgi:hypothetical protein
MSFYDQGQYGFRVRKWFGLGAKWGGDGMGAYGGGSEATLTIRSNKIAGGFYMGTHDPGTVSHVERWYPPGPIPLFYVRLVGMQTLGF